MKGYIYKTTYLPTGEMYFGSRKLPEGLTSKTDSYRGSPQKGSNRMAELFATKPAEEFSKGVLFEGEYAEVLELESLVIEAAWEKWGKVSEGGLVTNLVAVWGRSAVMTAETRAKMSVARKGKTLSAETRAKIGAAKSNPSAETRAKISAAMSNPSAETRAKISAAQKGKTQSAETRAKIGAAQKGKSVTAETRAKMSVSKFKAVINTATGQVWPTVREAAKSEGISQGSMSKRIRKGLKGGIWKYV